MYTQSLQEDVVNMEVIQVSLIEQGLREYWDFLNSLRGYCAVMMQNAETEYAQAAMEDVMDFITDEQREVTTALEAHKCQEV